PPPGRRGGLATARCRCCPLPREVTGEAATGGRRTFTLPGLGAGGSPAIRTAPRGGGADGGRARTISTRAAAAASVVQPARRRATVGQIRPAATAGESDP